MWWIIGGVTWLICGFLAYKFICQMDDLFVKRTGRLHQCIRSDGVAHTIAVIVCVLGGPIGAVTNYIFLCVEKKLQKKHKGVQ